MPWAPPSGARQRRGRAAHFAGLAAEDLAARRYAAGGASILARRHRTPDGEIDLIVQDGAVLTFVEVKRRKHGLGPDSPVTAKQWRRLECAAIHYMMAARNATGVHPICRFDVAVVDAQSNVQIIENARSFEEH